EAAPAKPQMAATAELPKPVTPAVIGPQIALPEVPKPAAEPAPAPVAKSEPAAAPLPPAALTPPPLKPEPAVAKVEPAPVPAPAPQLASLTPPPPAPVPAAAPAPAVSSRGDVLTVPFAGESSSLSESSLADLDRLVKRMKKDEGLSLQLMAYAEGDDANASKARRTSLSRALEVRKYLMEQGLRATRIEVRALGNKVEGGGPADRVDAVLVSR
ncbi:MAG TPA: OmpA family protein, partial [Magnetospirillum sp.]|nr:OmpA family protein [Magnetospirillum sp.]